MLAKVLMCSCFVEKFHNEDLEYVKKFATSNASPMISTLYIFLAVKNTHTSPLKFQKWIPSVNVHLLMPWRFAISVDK